MCMRRLFSVILAVSLSGCAATIPPVEVTRFHLGKEIPLGAVRIVGDSTLEATPYAVAVSQSLTRLGFSDAGISKAAPLYTATVSHGRLTREEAKRSPISIGIGGGSIGRNVGVGVGTSIGLGGGVRQIIVTRLSVQIKRASDQQAIWEGRAETEAPAIAPASQPGLAAEKLANALFRDFPGVSGTTITVP
jgi:Domain of unknown function (DUF4136)